MKGNCNQIIEKMFLENADFQSFRASYDFGRGLFCDKEDQPNLRAYIVASRNLTIWKVIEDKLQTKEDTVLFNGENYIIEWQFDYVLHIGGEIKTQIFFFHWKGMNAVKGFSPLPANTTSEDAIVERIYQWGEPPVFFQLFPERLIVLNANEDTFNPDIPHLLMVRGEILTEIHLFEVPCDWKNFRSQTVFFVIIPNKNTIYVWKGLSSDSQLLTNLRRCRKLYSNILNIHKSWESFQFVEVNEGEDEALEGVLGNTVDYLHIEKLTRFTPKLFYLLFNGDIITPVEIKNPLRHPKVISPFPFVQTHLYTAPQPAMFVLDNYNEVWLWKGLVKPDTCVETITEQEALAKDLVSAYVNKIKESRGVDITVHYSNAGQEPIEFTNIFPYWK